MSSIILIFNTDTSRNNNFFEYPFYHYPYLTTVRQELSSCGSVPNYLFWHTFRRLLQSLGNISIISNIFFQFNYKEKRNKTITRTSHEGYVHTNCVLCITSLSLINLNPDDLPYKFQAIETIRNR